MCQQNKDLQQLFIFNQSVNPNLLPAFVDNTKDDYIAIAIKNKNKLLAIKLNDNQPFNFKINDLIFLPTVEQLVYIYKLFNKNMMDHSDIVINTKMNDFHITTLGQCEDLKIYCSKMNINELYLTFISAVCFNQFWDIYEQEWKGLE